MLQSESRDTTPTFQLCSDLLSTLDISLEERQRIELQTHKQSGSEEWFSVQSKRITGSKCGRILCQKKKSLYILRDCLYPKPLDPPPKPIAWGRTYESVAIKKYEVRSNITVQKCGFVIS